MGYPLTPPLVESRGAAPHFLYGFQHPCRTAFYELGLHGAVGPRSREVSFEANAP